jgi:tetraacyldisaccharide 4'-kinase
MASQLRNVFLPFSVLYGGIVSARNFCYDNHIFKIRKLPVPVISVGNISVGGSGKTPFVLYLLEKILSLGKKPAVLSLGYKRITSELRVSCPHKGSEVDVRFLGDEPALISQNFPDIPVAVHKNRFRAGLMVLEKFGADIFVLDDGFQNRELHRDVDFVLLSDSLRDLTDHYLPAGNLRDSRRRIWEADVIVVTSHGVCKTQKEEIIPGYSNTPVAGIGFVAFDLINCVGQTFPLELISGREVVAFCGIARPDQFFSGIERLGSKIVRKKIFRDHHWFDEYDIDEIFGGDEDIIAITTLKDAVRIFLDQELAWKEEARRIYALREKAVVNFGEEHINNMLTKVCGQIYA